jgi:ParB-like chromosome segregation protein Spo0J
VQIELLAVESLVPYARNARTHSDAQVSQIAGSIREFGFTNPVLIGADNDIIAGHCRVLAARVLKLDTVPCIRLGHLTEAQRRAYVIADNRIALNSGWDEAMLINELDALLIEGYNLDLTGFNEMDLSTMKEAWESDLATLESKSGASIDRPMVSVIFKVVVGSEQQAREVIRQALADSGIEYE